MQNIYITGTGFWIPEDGLTTNDEVVNSYNTFVDNFNVENAEAISAGMLKLYHTLVQNSLKKHLGLKQGICMTNIVV